MRVTIELDDGLLGDVEMLAIRRGSTLRALVEEGLRLVVGVGESGRPVELPIYAGPPLPADFPWQSGKAMLAYLDDGRL